MKLWLLKRNYKLFNQLTITKKLLLKIIEDDECAFQRNIKAVEYIDSITNQCAEFKEIRKILTKLETNGFKNSRTTYKQLDIALFTI